MVDTIKKRIDEYIEFDSDILFIDKLVRIFGGAVRDSISGDKIHDIDILCGSRSVPGIEEILRENGYSFFTGLMTSVEITKLYTDINVISEPRTWIKDGKIIQLIRPSPLGSDTVYHENFHNLLSNVDISACGVSYSKGVLYENYEGAVSHCLSKTFRVNTFATMYIERRIHHRTGKLMERGWEQLRDNIIDNRDDKLNRIFNKQVDYTMEYGRIGRHSKNYASADDMFNDFTW